MLAIDSSSASAPLPLTLLPLLVFSVDFAFYRWLHSSRSSPRPGSLHPPTNLAFFPPKKPPDRFFLPRFAESAAGSKSDNSSGLLSDKVCLYVSYRPSGLMLRRLPGLRNAGECRRVLGDSADRDLDSLIAGRPRLVFRKRTVVLHNGNDKRPGVVNGPF